MILEIPRQHLFGALGGMLAAVVVSVGVGVFELARWKTARSKRTGAGFGDSSKAFRCFLLLEPMRLFFSDSVDGREIQEVRREEEVERRQRV